MALGINTNIMSLNAQRNLSKSQDALTTSIQRLSSGLRINSAKDDAAGLAISERMNSQIRGLNVGVRNANDGISLLQTAEGSLTQVGDNLQRLRELAVQASNAATNADGRRALNEEATQLVAEIDRIAGGTNFNGVNLLDGTFTNQKFQVGANKGETIDISSIASAKADSLGVGSNSSYSTKVNGSATPTSVNGTALTAGGLMINGHAIGASTSDGVSFSDGDKSAIAKAAAINAMSAQTNVTASVNATKVSGTAGTTGGAFAFTLNGVDISGTTAAAAGSVTAGTNASTIAAAINAKSDMTGVTASFKTDGTFELNAADGRNITIAATTAGDTGLAAATTYGSITLSSTSKDGISIGGTAGQIAAAGLTAGTSSATVTAGAGVSKVDLSTADGAQNALATIDAALKSVSSSRASLGAYQNRFSAAIASIQSTVESTSAARSRITDTDFASETANLSRAQVLQQAGTAMLQQANSSPNSVLSLLRG